MSAASLIATHMNAPYGRIVSAEDVVASFKSGVFAASSKEANDILEALFIEVSPDLILKCAEQIQVPVEMVNHLLIPIKNWTTPLNARLEQSVWHQTALLHNSSVAVR